MAVVKDTYILETQTPDFKGLDTALQTYQDKLAILQGSLKKALADPAAANIGQKNLEALVSKLQKIEEIDRQIAANKSGVLGGKLSVDLSATGKSVASLTKEVLELRDALASSGKASTFLDSTVKAGRAASGRGLKIAAAGNAGGFDPQARNQLSDERRALALQGIRGAAGTADAAIQASRVSRAEGIDKIVTDSKQLVEVLSAMANAAGKATLTDKELADATKKLVIDLKDQAQAEKLATQDLLKQEAVTAAAAKASEFFADKKRAEIRALVDLRNELRANARAATEASTAVGSFGARFANLGGERAAKALQELTEAFAKNKTNAAQRIQLADDLIKKYEKEAEATKKVSDAVNQEGIERARARAEAAKAVGAEIALGRLSDKQGGRAIQDVGKRIDSGELRDAAQVQKAVTAEIAKQRELERAITLENKLQAELAVLEKREQAVLTVELTKQSKLLGYNKLLHGDMRSVMAQTVAEAQKLGLTYTKDKVAIDALLKSNVELKKLQSEAGPKQLNQFGVAFAAGFAAQQIAEGLTQVINRFAEFEDELIKVRRTADASRETMSVLGKEILNIGQRVPVAAKQLASAAAVLGQAGALAFDPNVDYDAGSAKIQDAAKAIELVAQVALVAELNIEQAATSYGQFAVVFSKDVDRITTSLKAMGVEGASTSDAMRVLFGSINEVGNKTVATTEDILTFIRQFGGTAASFGIAAEKVAALGGAVRDAGAHADVAGTAFVRFFSRATQDADEFGKVLNISADAFRSRFTADALGTIVDVFKELGAQSKVNKLAVTDFLRSLKVESREQGVFTKIIENYALLETRLEYGQDLAKNYNSVQGESAKRAETWSASVTKLSNAFQALVQTLEPSVAIFSKLVSILADIIKFVASSSWTVFLTTGVVIGGGLAFAVLQAVKLVVQFQLAAQAIKDMSTQMRDFVSEMQRARGVPPPGAGPTGPVPPVGGSRVGSTIARGAGTAAALAGGLLLATSLQSEYGEKGKEAGEALTEGIAKGIEEGKPKIVEESNATAKETATSWLTAIGSIGLALAGLATPLYNAGKWLISLGSGIGALAGKIGYLVKWAVFFKGAVSATFSTVLAGATATVAVFTAALTAAAVAGYAFGTALNKWVIQPLFRKDLLAAKEEVERLNYAGESWLRIQKAIGASTTKLTKPFEDGVESIKKANVASTTLLNTWKDLAKRATEAAVTMGTVNELFDKLTKTKDLTEALEFFDAIKKAGDSDLGELDKNAATASTEFGKLAVEVEKLTGRKVKSKFFFDAEDVRKSADEAKKALAEEGDELREVLTANIEKLNAARERARTTGDSGDEKALAALEVQNAALVSKLKAIGDITSKITKDAVEDFSSAIAASVEARAAKGAVEASAKSRIDALRKEVLQDFNKSMSVIGGIINELEEKAETGASAVVEDYAGKRADFFNKLNTQIKAASLLDKAGGTDENAQKLAQTAKDFSKAWDDAFANAWGKAAKTAVREAFDELKAVVAANFDELELERRGEDIAIRKLEAEGRDRLQQIADEKDALQKYADAVRRGATAFESFRKLGVDASVTAVRPIKEAEGVIDGLADSFFTTADAMRDAFADAAEAMEEGGVRVEDTFLAIQKAAKDTAKLIKQTAFDTGIEKGGEEIDRRERDKGVTRTLRQSSTARNLVGNIRQVRAGGGDEALQGAEIGRLIRKAELKFEEQGVDAGDFLSKVKEELADTFKQDDKNNPALAAREVGAKTNEYLSQIAKVLGASTTSQQGGAVASALGSDKKRPSSAREFTARAREAGNDIVKLEKEASAIRDPAEKRRREFDIQGRKDALEKESVQFAIDEAFAKSGLLKKKGALQQPDVDKANKILSDLINSPALKNVKGLDELRQKSLLGEDLVNFEDLNAARDRATGKSKGKITPVDERLTETATNASQAVKDQAAAQDSLVKSLDALITTLGDAKYTERIKTLEQTINKTTTAVGGGG